MQRRGRRGANGAPRSFSGNGKALAAALVASRAALLRVSEARNRLQAKQARCDRRDWQMKRRERTRQLIELGGLVAKAGLVDLTDDDRAAILRILIEAAAKLRATDGTGHEQLVAIWRRRGRRAFNDDEVCSR